MGNRIESLDGLRGIAALWVLLGHVSQLTGAEIPILTRTDLAVDLFIMLSGYLMVFQYNARREREPWEAPTTWLRFGTRRFFRIAPLYYLALAAALTFGADLFEARSAIAVDLPNQTQMPERYLDRSALNVWLHATFIFGALPEFSFRTPLPDWSIGLEMQYYAAFPAIMLIVMRLGWLRGVLLVAGGAAVIGWAIERSLAFPMPSFLPLKLHLFFVGMLLAAAINQQITRMAPMIALAIALALLPIWGDDLTGMARLLLAGLLFVSVQMRRPPLLATATFRWLGELSYGAYLFHLLILLPVAAALVSLDRPARFALVAVVTVPLTYAIAYLGYRFIEVPGQKLGRMVVNRVTKQHFVPTTT